ncbi:MAG: hypothetical protein JSS52_11275 [Proteobacteria bacterium]|nr:hypothetical protein [Pseudomonadota bacterium]
MSDLDDMFVHTVIVETYEGTNGYGEDVFAAPVTVVGFLESADRLFRTANAEQETAESAFYTDPGNAPLFEVDSRVTVAGKPARVVRTGLFTSGELELPDHAVVLLGSPRTR